jgi:hypothetical protein
LGWQDVSAWFVEVELETAAFTDWDRLDESEKVKRALGHAHDAWASVWSY